VALQVSLDPAIIQEQRALLRGMLANPGTSARQRYLINELLRMLAQLEDSEKTAFPASSAPAEAG